MNLGYQHQSSWKMLSPRVLVLSLFALLDAKARDEQDDVAGVRPSQGPVRVAQRRAKGRLWLDIYFAAGVGGISPTDTLQVPLPGLEIQGQVAGCALCRAQPGRVLHLVAEGQEPGEYLRCDVFRHGRKFHDFLQLDAWDV
eukprot:scaffold349831_cov42-Prasinocladus_malaysianus.AAC.1